MHSKRCCQQGTGSLGFADFDLGGFFGSGLVVSASSGCLSSLSFVPGVRETPDATGGGAGAASKDKLLLDILCINVKAVAGSAPSSMQISSLEDMEENLKQKWA